MSFGGFPAPPTPGPGPTPTPNTHNLLSSSHGDTTAATPGAGSIIVSLTGVWEEVVSGAELDHLVIVGGVPTWSAQTLVGVAGDILYATGVNAFGNLALGSPDDVLTVVGGAPQWAAASGGAGGPIIVAPATGITTTITDTDYFVVVSGSTTINLPPAPSEGQRHIVKDSTGSASTTPVVVDGNGALIDDSATYSLVNNFESATFIFSSMLGRWQLT